MDEESQSRGIAGVPDTTDLSKMDFRERSHDGNIEQRYEDMMRRLADLESRFRNPDPLAPTFAANMHTDGTWAESLIASGSSNAFTDSTVRLCNSTASQAMLVAPVAAQALVLQVHVANAAKFLLLTLPTTLIQITGHNGTGPVSWNPYTANLITGGTTFSWNGLEPIDGNPGPSGLHFLSNGSLSGTACVGLPVGSGNGWTPAVWDFVNGRWTFAIPNSAA